MFIIKKKMITEIYNLITEEINPDNLTSLQGKITPQIFEKIYTDLETKEKVVFKRNELIISNSGKVQKFGLEIINNERAFITHDEFNEMILYNFYFSDLNIIFLRCGDEIYESKVLISNRVKDNDVISYLKKRYLKQSLNP